MSKRSQSWNCDIRFFSFSKMLKFYILAIIAVLCLFVSVQPESCYNYGRNQNLAQAAFLFDLQYANNTDAKRKYEDGIKNIIGQSHRAIIFGAVATYGRIASDNKDSCFNLKQGFSHNQGDISSAFRKITSPVSKSNSPISSVAFAAADSHIGWLPGYYTSKGLRIRRIVVFFTDHTDNLEKESQHIFYGNGHDNCRSVLDYASVRRTLREKGVAVLGLYKDEHIKRKYDLTFYAFGIPYCSKVYHDNNLARVLETSFENCLSAVEKCSGEKIVEDKYADLNVVNYPSGGGSKTL